MNTTKDHYGQSGSSRSQRHPSGGLSAIIGKLALLVTLASLAWTAQAERILFIGNSYTYVNDLPKILKEIVNSTGAAAPEMKSATPGGEMLTRHLTREATLTLIDEGNWDAVILQATNTNAVRLHAKEGSHPTFNGSYLAALILHATLHHPASLSVPYHDSLSDAEAAYLQKLATEVLQRKQPADGATPPQTTPL